MSRTLSFQGAEFDVFDHELEPETARAYDEAVTFWIDLKEALDEMYCSICRCSIVCGDACLSVCGCVISFFMCVRVLLLGVVSWSLVMQ